MRQHAELPNRGLQRVVDALERYSPPNDLTIIHVNGRLHRAERDARRAGRYAVIQYCLASTKNPDPNDWLPLWRGAECVWSYYDLPFSDQFNFYHAPLGTEFKPFLDDDGPRPYTALTHGTYMTESTKEVIGAAHPQLVAHIGPHLSRPNVVNYHDLDDTGLSYLYRGCKWVSGLRRVEGFELPALEGLVNGARPVLFDKPHYRQWFGDHADYIEEVPREGVVEQLKELFSKPPKPVTLGERYAIAYRFRWEAIIDEFWRRVSWTP